MTSDNLNDMPATERAAKAEQFKSAATIYQLTMVVCILSALFQLVAGNGVEALTWAIAILPNYGAAHANTMLATILRELK